MPAACAPESAAAEVVLAFVAVELVWRPLSSADATWLSEVLRGRLGERAGALVRLFGRPAPATGP